MIIAMSAWWWRHLFVPLFRGRPSSLRKLLKMAPDLSYPNVRRDESAITDYHGTKISDPYIWLEDPDSKETEAFVEQQNAITMPYLADCETREKFKTRWDKLIFTDQHAAR